MTQQWTQTPPTEPGWYWYYHCPMKDMWMVEIKKGRYGYLYAEGFMSEIEELDAYWLGPITPPEPPEEKP